MNPRRFKSYSLIATPHEDKITRIMAAAINAVDPRVVIYNNLFRRNNILSTKSQSYDLNEYKRVFLFGFGKASLPMTKSAAKIIGEYLTLAIAIAKSHPNQPTPETLFIQPDIPPITVFEAGHPIPDERNLRATQKVIDILLKTNEKDLIILLISGGGSALLSNPVASITLDAIQSLTNSLLNCGATINEINCIRKHLSRVKGGLFVRLAPGSNILSLILSDVIRDPLDIIASGPTVPDPTTFRDAVSILRKYNLVESTPEVIIDYISQGVLGKNPETPKPGDPIFKNVTNIIIGNNKLASQAAKTQALSEGFRCNILSNCLQGEARYAGRLLGALTKQFRNSPKGISSRTCLIIGGETTVKIIGNGKGGRNQELALASVRDLNELNETLLVTLATDGDDGPSGAAGAVVTNATMARGRNLGLDPDLFLNRNDSYNYFKPLGDLLITGPTDTNVGDLTFIFFL